MKNAYTYNEAYMIFVLGYDLMHDLLVDEGCDSAMEICEQVYNEFKGSLYDAPIRSEYECLEQFIDGIRDLKFLLDNEYICSDKEYLSFKNKQVFELPLTYKEMAIALTLKTEYEYITTSDVDVAMAYAENGKLL